MNIKDAIDQALVTGAEVHIPAGIHTIAEPVLSIDQSALTDYGPKRINLRGDGKGNTILNFVGSGLSYKGNVEGAGIAGLFTVSDLQLRGSGVGIGLSIDIAAMFSVRDVFISGFDTGMVGTDILSADFHSVAWQFNKTGFDITKGVFSPPNALTFTSCIAGNNSFMGGVITHPAAFTWTGGSIESNGSMGSGGGGIEIISAGDDGGVGANFFGTYFENNADGADINIQHGAAAGVGCVYNAFGCMFNREGVSYVKNNILLASDAPNGPAVLNTIGCGFRGFNGYVPDWTRPYIAISPGGAYNVKHNELGNFYSSSVERLKS